MLKCWSYEGAVEEASIASSFLRNCHLKWINKLQQTFLVCVAINVVFIWAQFLWVKQLPFYKINNSSIIKFVLNIQL